MGEKPSDSHTLDRINVNGHYEPSNCRWATRAEQGKNKRASNAVAWNGKDSTFSDVIQNIHPDILAERKRVGRDLSIQEIFEFILTLRK